MTSRSRVLVSVAAVLGAGLSSVPAAADPPEFQASVSSDDIGIDQTVQLTITLSRDANQAYQGYMRPVFKDFAVLNQAETESTQWTINGTTQTTRTIEQHVYVLKPRHKGSCVIPAASVRIEGKQWTTQELVVHVGAARQQPSGQGQSNQSGQTGSNPMDPFGQLRQFGFPGLGNPAQPAEPQGMRGDEDLFVGVDADRTTAYVGQQVVVTWSLYSRGDVLRYRATAEPKHDDFWSEELDAPKGTLSAEHRVVHGQEFLVSRLMREALFPLRSGKLTITPLQIEATTERTLFYAMGSAVRASRPITIDVQPLPVAGQPDDFPPSNVGHFALNANVDRSQVNAGDSLTYRLTLTGEGNLRNVKLPKIDKLDGFKVYDPTVTESISRNDRVSGARSLAYVLLPKRGGELTIPGQVLWYFNPETRKYEKSETQPIKITVVGDPQKIGAPPETSHENVLGPGMKPIRPARHLRASIGERVLRGRAFLVALALPPLLFLSAILGMAFRARLRRETVGSRRRKARALARKRLRTCELHIKGQRPSAFFGECGRAIYEQLEMRLGTRFEACTMEELRRQLSDRGFGAQLVDQVVGELESCDYARFTRVASGPGEMREALGRARSLLEAIERAPISGREEEEVAA